MSTEPKVPWFVWTIVTLSCAMISAYAVIEAANRRGNVSNNNSAPAIASPAPTLEVTPEPQIEFSIWNELAPRQVSEYIKVYIEGRLIARLVVDEQNPNASVKIRVPNSGSYSYRVLADGHFINQFGQTYHDQAFGDGVLEVSDGSIFILTLTPNGLTLVPR
ncbi:hypothetical protein LC605_03655 [Nostoc sp. CHAB 5836]|uniref:hypothetical protein n=1 Tax=Nostoc sp. CHAB 5836 TaxID=2780404 RepID=UPI001E52261D|nr:hypothetical protein [Nostoc sp. CHAB 5836]MCC5614185.1 hypothetical protein [Nostoc sp. CHAB 5836]